MIRADSDRLLVRGPARLRGTVEAPGDKSLSHRALLCAAVARGESAIENLSPGDDVGATGTALRALGVAVHRGWVR